MILKNLESVKNKKNIKSNPIINVSFVSQLTFALKGDQLIGNLGIKGINFANDI